MWEKAVVAISSVISPPIVFLVSVLILFEAAQSKRRGWYFLGVAWLANLMYLRLETIDYEAQIAYLGKDFLLLNAALLTAILFLAYSMSVRRQKRSAKAVFLIAVMAGAVVAAMTALLSNIMMGSVIPLPSEGGYVRGANAVVLTPLILFSCFTHLSAARANWIQLKHLKTSRSTVAILVPGAMLIYALLQLTYYSKLYLPALFTIMLTMALVSKVLYGAGIATLVTLGMEERKEDIVRTEQYETKQRSFSWFAHEMKNPAYGINNRAEAILQLLRDRKFPKAELEVENLIKQTDLMVYIVDSLKVAAERVPKGDRVEVSLNHVLDLSLAQVELQEEILPGWVSKDYGRGASIVGIENPLVQVFTNLLRNALEACQEIPPEDFRPSRGVRLRLRTRRVRSKSESENGGDRIEVSIIDYGPGIPESHRRAIFEPYYSTKEGPIRGLGLWVAQTFVQDFGGKITIESPIPPLKRGTIVGLDFPAVTQ